jgi:hypothetical protein
LIASRALIRGEPPGVYDLGRRDVTGEDGRVRPLRFLSEKTVEVNLTRVYRKLEVRSRTALAARFAARPVDET